MIDKTGLRYYAAFLLLCIPFSAFAEQYSGVVWKRRGAWHINGGSSGLRLGEAIPPGGLLTADGTEGAHSLVVLLPDGQRLLCECYEARTCAQGFRVPAIASPPTATVWAMFVGVRNALLMRPAVTEEPFPEPAGRDEAAANIELVAPLGQGKEAGKVSIAPGLRVLPSGHYSLQVRGDGAQPNAQSGATATLSDQPLEWTPKQGTAQIQVPSQGLYRVTVVDETRVPRIELELLVTSPRAFFFETEALKQLRLTVIEWNRVHEGWSLHDFLRVYLQSRALELPSTGYGL